MDFGLTPDHISLRLAAREFAEKRLGPMTESVYRSEEFPWKNFRLLNESGYLPMYFPEEYGGSGTDLLSFALVVEEVARVCSTSASILTLHVLGCGTLLYGGSHELKAEWMPKVVAGEALGCFGLTEPQAGSDNLAMQTRAVRDGDHYIINGRKQFISNADVAHFMTCFAKTNPDAGADGISAFVVPKGTPGLVVGQHERKMGANNVHACEVVFEDCRVPARNMVGEEGKGFRLAMRALNDGRPAVAARAVGLAQGALDHALRYARERVQFNRPIVEFQAIQFMLADMATQIEAARQLVYRACAAVSAGDTLAARYGAMAKLFATDVAMKVTTDAVQIFGGYGYMKDYPVERLMAEAKLSQIIEGTNQVQRIVIARSLLRGG